jgi:hypothetical protein
MKVQVIMEVLWTGVGPVTLGGVGDIMEMGPGESDDARREVGLDWVPPENAAARAVLPDDLN